MNLPRDSRRPLSAAISLVCTNFPRKVRIELKRSETDSKLTSRGAPETS
jgi:hypothetical protein